VRVLAIPPNQLKDHRMRDRPTIWCTPTTGFPLMAARAFAAVEQMVRDPAIPGPRV